MFLYRVVVYMSMLSTILIFKCIHGIFHERISECFINEQLSIVYQISHLDVIYARFKCPHIYVNSLKL